MELENKRIKILKMLQFIVLTAIALLMVCELVFDLSNEVFGNLSSILIVIAAIVALCIKHFKS